MAATASDNVGVARVEFRVDGALIASDASAPYAATWNAASASAGGHTILATAYDAAGNSTNSSVIVTVPAAAGDTTAPTVAITSPAAGASVSGSSVALAATASDNVGVARVEFRVDGALIASDASAPYAATWNAASASAGGHTILATAYDAAGNSTNSSVIVTVPAAAGDTTPPTVAFTQPAAGATVTGWQNPVATASDNVGVTEVEFTVDGTLLGVDTAAPYGWMWDTSTVAPGSHTIRAVASDAAGNTTSVEHRRHRPGRGRHHAPDRHDLKPHRRFDRLGLIGRHRGERL